MELRESTKFRVDEVRKMLEQGSTRKAIIEVFSKKYDVGSNSIDKYIAFAREQIKKIEEQIDLALSLQEKINEVTVAAGITIASVTERKQILTSIAKGEKIGKQTVFRADGQAVAIEVYPTYHERIRAIDLLNKMGNDYLPDTLEIEHKHTVEVKEQKPEALKPVRNEEQEKAMNLILGTLGTVRAN